MKDLYIAGYGIERVTVVFYVLHTPRENCWGVLDEISPAGVFLRGLDLNAFDDWLSALVHEEPFVGFGDLFFPMWRIERIFKDEASGGIPSLCDQLIHRTGRSIEEVVAANNTRLE